MQSSSKSFDFSAAIDSSLSVSARTFSELIGKKLGAFAESFSLQSGLRVKEAVRKATKETLVCRKKGSSSWTTAFKFLRTRKTSPNA